MPCDANKLVALIHLKATITTLEPADHDHWLTSSYDDVLALQHSYPSDRMTVRGSVFQTQQAGPHDQIGYRYCPILERSAIMRDQTVKISLHLNKLTLMPPRHLANHR